MSSIHSLDFGRLALVCDGKLSVPLFARRRRDFLHVMTYPLGSLKYVFYDNNPQKFSDSRASVQACFEEVQSFLLITSNLGLFAVRKQTREEPRSGTVILPTMHLVQVLLWQLSRPY